MHFRTADKNKLSLSHKRKHDKEDQPKKRGRPRLIDKDRPKATPTSTPVIPVSSLPGCYGNRTFKCGLRINVFTGMPSSVGKKYRPVRYNTDGEKRTVRGDKC